MFPISVSLQYCCHGFLREAHESWWPVQLFFSSVPMGLEIDCFETGSSPPEDLLVHVCPPPSPLWFHSLSGTKNFVCMSIVPILVTMLRSQFTVYLGEMYFKSIAKSYGRLWGNLIKLDTEAVLDERASAVIRSIFVGKMMKNFCQTDIFLKQIWFGTKGWLNPLTTKIL